MGLIETWRICIKSLKFFWIKPYRLFFLLAGLMLFIGLSQLHTAYDTANYTESTGEICNVTSKKVHRRGSYVTRYQYDLVWYADGQFHRKHYNNQVEPGKEGECRIWVQPGNRDVILGSPENIKSGAVKYILFSVGFGFIGGIFWLVFHAGHRETAEERMERLENTKIYSVLIFIFCLFGMGLAGFDLFVEYRDGEYRSTVTIDFILLCIGIAMGCVVAFFTARNKSKR